MTSLLKTTLIATLAMLTGSPLLAADLGPVEVELRGETQTWAETGSVIETAQDAKFQTERYGDEFTYVLKGLPPGPARMKLGFCEFKHDKAGQRVFDILINDRMMFEAFDILEWGEPKEAVVVPCAVTVPETGELRVTFRAQEEYAKINYFRVYTADWAVEVTAADTPEVILGKVTRDDAHMQQAYETCIGKFGSRICINPRPQKGVCPQTALGHADYNVAYFERNPSLYAVAQTPVYYAVRCAGSDGEDIWYSLPFNGRLTPFTDIRQQQTLTSLTYTCTAPGLPVEVTYAFHAPFYPQDIKLSCAPYVLLDVTVRNLTGKAQTGDILVGHTPRPTEIARRSESAEYPGVLFDLPVFGKKTTHGWLFDAGASGDVTAQVGTLSVPRTGKMQATDETDGDGRSVLKVSWSDAAGGLSWQFNLRPGDSDTRTFAYVGWVQEPVLEVRREPYHFKYVDLFRDIYEVAQFAFANREEIDRKVALFESTVYDATAPEELKQFLAFAFQSWMQNTFYCASDKGEDWFSVWEGCCKFHSTVDVEYNVAPLYFEYWPELMKLTMRQWVHYIRNGILSHDMGMGLQANGMEYGHDMEVEENTNFVLLLYHYWRQTGDEALVRELFGSVKELLGHVISCDTDEDGFHERGTYNTIDQGSAAIQYAKDQTYLAVRALCAFACGEEMAKLVDDREAASEWRRQGRLVSRTLDDEAWLGDRYAVVLNQPPKQPEPPAQDPWRVSGPARNDGMAMMGGDGPGGDGPAGGGWDNWNQPATGQWNPSSTYSTQSTYKPPSGWDGHSIYANNGMLYPLRSGLKLEGINLEKMRKDLRTTTLATLKQYGSPHSDNESNMWVSQNIWRDMAAAYMGVDMTDNIGRYLNLQRYINRDKRGCFTDVYVYGSDHISLDYYPRGTAAFGVMPAMAGLQIDKTTGTVSVAPVRTPLRIPLLAYADWAQGKVPWLNVTMKNGKVRASVDGDPQVEVTVRETGEPW